MKWEGNRESDNVEDRRGESGGGGGGFGLGGRSIGIGTIAIALIGSYFLGISPTAMLDMLSGGGGSAPPQERPAASQVPRADDRDSKFVRTVLADTEDVWGKLLREEGTSYAPPKLVLFTGSTGTACGAGQAASGPFYCPSDRQVYIDLSFFGLMKERFHVAGDFAQANVISHEVGHHVQNLLGVSEKVQRAQQRASTTQANALSVRLELQADCFAGVWAFHANRSRSILEQGDIETALNAATAIGDDALQRQARGQVVPDSFTHGSSAQRVRWFTKGIQTGQLKECNTFEARQL